MVIQDGRLVCTKCGYKKKIGKNTKTKITEKIEKKEEIMIISDEEEKKTFPKTKVICPNCGYNEAIWWMQQTRAADEPPTMFFKCLKCGHTWREY